MHMEMSLFYNFCYFFPQNVQYAEIGSKTLTFLIYDFDRFSKHDQIGQVQVPLNSVDLGRVVEEWRDLTSPEADNEKVSPFELTTPLFLFCANSPHCILGVYLLQNVVNISLFTKTNVDDS